MPRDDDARIQDIVEACERIRLHIHGMRDVVIHQYFGIDKALTWQAASVDVPSLAQALRMA